MGLLTKAVFLDALGTLVDMDPPWVHLAEALDREVSPERLVTAVRAEMRYYREHSHEGRDTESLADLRRRCAQVLSAELGFEVGVEELIASVRFHAFDDAPDALAELRSRGLRLVVVSNWDCSLSRVLELCALRGAVDGVVSSAEAGARKPDPRIFVPALEIAGCGPAEAVHVGDTPEEDVAGASAAGIRALLLERGGGGDIASLGEIGQHL